jgi:Cellulase (glycosyl hydrolase family 5)
MRWFLALLAVCSSAAAVSVFLLLRTGTEEPVTLPANPMPGRLLVGFQDDASLRWAPDRADLLDRARDAGAAVIRTTVVWAQAAPQRPRNATDPFDAAYRLDDLDELARNAQQRGIELLITIWGSPEWANGGRTPNYPPADAGDLRNFAYALADRYSGRHAGYPSVRLFSAWNEPNLEQFLAPQFDERGRSASPRLYAPLADAVYDGVKEANPDTVVAIGETSPRGHDAPSLGPVQDSHSPPRFARLLAEEDPDLSFDAWAQHPYPATPATSPTDPVRWPRVGLGNLERFGDALDEWFGRDEIPLLVTEYAHETRPGDSTGIEPSVQARYLQEALAVSVGNPRVRAFVWFVLRDRSGTPWQSGLLDEDGSPKPAFAQLELQARGLDARNPVIPSDAEVARVPALELAFHNPAGAPIDVRVEKEGAVSVPLEASGWIDVPLDGVSGDRVRVRAIDPFGHVLSRSVLLAGSG